MEYLSRYGVALIQLHGNTVTDMAGVTANMDSALQYIDWAVDIGSYYGSPVKLVVLPEFGMHGFPYQDNKDWIDAGICSQIPGPEMDRFVAKAKEHDLHIVPGSWPEWDPKYPAHVFNTACVVNGDGVILKYRKVYPWIPDEGTTSPMQIKGYDEELFPVVDTPLGKLGVQICHDGMIPEVSRSLTANGAEVLIRCSAYMHPFVNSGPMDWQTAITRTRSIENICYGIYCGGGSALTHMPPLTCGGTFACDYEGRILAQISETGEHILYTHFDMDALRAWRTNSLVHNMFGHLRSEAHTYMDKPVFPCNTHGPNDMIYAADYKRMTIETRTRLWGEPQK